MASIQAESIDHTQLQPDNYRCAFMIIVIQLFIEMCVSHVALWGLLLWRILLATIPQGRSKMSELKTSTSTGLEKAVVPARPSSSCGCNIAVSLI